MKIAGTIILLFGAAFSFSATAGTAFKCVGQESRFEVIQGWYNGAGSDSVLLKSSSVYGIYNIDDYGKPLTLKRDRDTVRTRGHLKDFPIQFLSKQRDDIGSATTVFAIDMGVFGASIGKAFQAVLVTENQHLLDCELVESVDLN